MDDQPTVPTTRVLERVQQDPMDRDAWNELVVRYGGRFYGWCRKRGLQHSDADDLTQDVFARLAQRVRSFDKLKGPARAWLFTILRNCLNDWLARRQRRPEVSLGAEQWQRLTSSEADEDLERCLVEESDLEELENRVRPRLRGEHTWAAYWLTCKEGLTAAEASARLGVPEAHVIRYKNRVLQMLRDAAAAGAP